MDRLIRQITDQLVSRLPDSENFYRIQNLDEYGFPPFLIRRIHIELQWNLDESMVLPKTDWANTGSESVQQSWQRFLSAIHAEVQLPASYARAVIETAVADVVETLIEPRKSIPEILFGGEDVLLAEQLKERTELLVVYPHFSNVLTTYVERKNKDKLDREHCHRIIMQVDEKITYQYTPLQWAQMLDPLFTLRGNSIDTNIFRLFFEDKKRPRIARKFDLMNDSISRAKFIEVLSSPDMLDYEGYEPDQSELFSGEKTTETEEKIQQERDVSAEAPSENTDDVQEADQQESDDETEEKIISDFSREDTQIDGKDSEKNEIKVEEEPPKKQTANGDIPRSTQQAEQEIQDFETEGVQEDEVKRSDESPTSLNEIFVDQDDEQETPLVEDVEDEPMNNVADQEPEVAENYEEQKEEGAIWQRYLSSDEEEEQRDEEEDLSDEPLYDDEYLDEPIIDLTDNNDVTEEKENLEKLLESERSYYVDEIFGGSEQAYEESLREIARQEDWKSASKEIEKNIFKRNMVNIYSEPAVDFTDRLQTYFLDKQNNNK